MNEPKTKAMTRPPAHKMMVPPSPPPITPSGTVVTLHGAEVVLSRNQVGRLLTARAQGLPRAR